MSGLDRFVTRRDMLYCGGMGIGALALSGVMKGTAFGGDTRSAAVNIESPLTPRQPHFAPTAKRVIHLFLSGGPVALLDTFDPKPAARGQVPRSAYASSRACTSSPNAARAPS